MIQIDLKTTLHDSHTADVLIVKPGGTKTFINQITMCNHITMYVYLIH